MQMDSRMKREEFQVWKLVVEKDRGVLTCEDGDGNAVYKQDITFTDFPEPEITIWFTDRVMLLPS